ncbi:gephyrin-like molybdotransferase Glp [Spirulina sp. CCNP1310]|uniref:molybdopterin molybdotransferase MoeA n=1 Tax=Spirulina sp. CCNP1310 TaxID=3110249 RepID=UPI002B207C11|nr:gephyrin-like molybdotransferase Glp [Spirulina sp. CCNP1310]MEA5419985.1 gephyrin-like molybdotransferase Glp [Spirulina sp. CCNP1310]
MLSVQVAEDLILNAIHPPQEAETVALTTALGRVLAQPVTSPGDLPPWDNSAMDGYAVRSPDVHSCPVTLEVVEEIAAGQVPCHQLQPGEAARIFTGAMVPPGADAIAIQEETQREGDRVTLLNPPQPGFIRKQGSYCRQGEVILPAGTRIGPAEMAVLATVQALSLLVYPQPKVAIFSTGNELIPPDATLQPGQIVDSNQWALTAAVSQLGAIAIPLGIVPDQPDALRAKMEAAISQADLVLSTGGVSVGDYDYVEGLLGELGGDIQIRSVAIKPGKPLTVANFPQCLYFGIPGNPVSALVTFWRFIAPALRKRAGLAAPWGPQWVEGRSPQTLKADGKRETYLWGQLHWPQGRPEFHPASGGHNSGNLINLARTTALAVLPVGVKEIAAGEPVQILVI